MTRITFQFVPSSFTDTEEIELKGEYCDSKSVDSGEFGITTIDLKDARLDIVASGSIRYSVNRQNISEEIIEQVYDEAVETITEVLTEDQQDYRVSLIIGEMDSYEQYYENRDSIYEFGSTVLKSENPDYTELDEHSVKISFGTDGRRVSV